MVDMEFLQAIADIMDQKLEEKLDPINSRLAGLETKVDSLQTQVDGLETKVEDLQSQVNGLENRMEHVESVTQSLQSGQIQIRKDLRQLTEKVDSAYRLALDAWGQSTENRSWLETAAH